MAKRRSKKDLAFFYSLSAAVLFLRAALYLYEGAWLWGIAYGALAVAMAFSAHKANAADQEARAAWKEYGSVEKGFAANADAYIKKCPDCGKFTRDADFCRICSYDFEYPPVKQAS
jgi:hypothetical protein